MNPPRFPKHDPAGAAFWEARYRERFTPWDAGRVPSRLREFVARSASPGRVLVPGCGAAYEVRFFADSGWDVEGIDFSAAALEAAAPVLGPWTRKARLADFFGAEVAGPFALVYERAFLCALPRGLWNAWAERLAGLIPAGGHLAGFFYLDREAVGGPPFALHDDAELRSLLEPHFARVEDAEVTDSIPVFVGKERWQVWQRE